MLLKRILFQRIICRNWKSWSKLTCNTFHL